MRVVVLYNQPVLPADDPEAEAERWVATAVENIGQILTAAEYDALPLAIGLSLASLRDEIALRAPDVVFNLFEGFADQPASEATVARLLEQAAIPFTGAASRPLRLCLDKPACKRRLVEAGLATPPWVAIERLPLPELKLNWPLIVKPACRDASEGLDQQSIATDIAELTDQTSAVLSRYGSPVMIEEFLSGREFTISLIEAPELTALPVAEVVFRDVAAASWPLLTYAAKWLPESADYEATDMRHAAPLAPELTERLVSLAKRAYRALGCRDYARIDIRLNADGLPMIIDVNPNPDLSPTACFAYALRAAGIERNAFILRLIQQAARREAEQPCTPIYQ